MRVAMVVVVMETHGQSSVTVTVTVTVNKAVQFVDLGGTFVHLV